MAQDAGKAGLGDSNTACLRFLQIRAGPPTSLGDGEGPLGSERPTKGGLQPLSPTPVWPACWAGGSPIGCLTWTSFLSTPHHHPTRPGAVDRGLLCSAAEGLAPLGRPGTQPGGSPDKAHQEADGVRLEGDPCPKGRGSSEAAHPKCRGDRQERCQEGWANQENAQQQGPFCPQGPAWNPPSKDTATDGAALNTSDPLRSLSSCKSITHVSAKSSGTAPRDGGSLLPPWRNTAWVLWPQLSDHQGKGEGCSHPSPQQTV